ncbi:MAG TPA: hypothetical protein H9906_02830 [Candidatus Paenalcaligenes intestinipullorum]|uniref:Uncharacterized protein n=1 Tax=Candidatus Paenalcaligenes intestinipullorum TaxID=2838718 RepID=A0A9D2RF74_9BURK|nr:hypothetical protein [Candidatus Paenalcaligenes intestinipullorum]
MLEPSLVFIDAPEASPSLAAAPTDQERLLTSLLDELRDNINRNLNRLVYSLTQYGHAEGPLPNTQRFSNFAAVARDEQQRLVELTLTYNKRYDTPAEVLALLPELAARLTNLRATKLSHPLLKSLPAFHATELNLIVSQPLEPTAPVGRIEPSH